MNGNICGYGIHTLYGNCGKYGGRIEFVDGIGHGTISKYGDRRAYGDGGMNIDRGGFLNGAAYDRGGYFGVRRDRSLFERERMFGLCSNQNLDTKNLKVSEFELEFELEFEV